MDEKIRAEFFLRRFSLMQGTILVQIDEELDNVPFTQNRIAKVNLADPHAGYLSFQQIQKHV